MILRNHHSDQEGKVCRMRNWYIKFYMFFSDTTIFCILLLLTHNEIGHLDEGNAGHGKFDRYY